MCCFDEASYIALVGKAQGFLISRIKAVKKLKVDFDCTLSLLLRVNYTMKKQLMMNVSEWSLKYIFEKKINDDYNDNYVHVNMYEWAIATAGHKFIVWHVPHQID